MKCRLCKTLIPVKSFKGLILNKSINYFDCKVCGYLQTENPTWLPKAYATNMNDSDTGVMFRNLSNVSLVTATLCLMRRRKSLIVDYAGGHGFLVRLLRDVGLDAWHHDPYSVNLVAKGFDYNIKKQKANAISLVLAFEVFEHFKYPVNEIKKIISISPNILFTTQIIPNPIPKPTDWWYYGPEHGQHIGFYRIKTLKFIAKKFNLHLCSDGVSTHFFSKKKYSFIIWMLFRFFSKIFSKLFTIGIKSKTWSDHLRIKNNLKNKSRISDHL
jgi:hypothetical protein